MIDYIAYEEYSDLSENAYELLRVITDNQIFKKISPYKLYGLPRLDLNRSQIDKAFIELCEKGYINDRELSDKVIPSEHFDEPDMFISASPHVKLVERLYEYAAFDDLDKVKKQLLKIQNKGIDLNSDEYQLSDSSPLMEALQHSATKTARFLIEEKIFDLKKLNNSGETALHFALKQNNPKIADLILSHESDFDLTRILFWYCKTYKFKHIVKYLLDKGAVLNDNDGSTALHFAAAGGNLKMLGYLSSEYDCNINSINQNGETPLHLACSQGKSKAIEWLVSNGANVNSVDINGNTPILRLCKAKQVLSSTIELLATHGADLQAKNNAQETALDLLPPKSRAYQFIGAI